MKENIIIESIIDSLLKKADHIAYDNSTSVIEKAKKYTFFTKEYSKCFMCWELTIQKLEKNFVEMGQILWVKLEKKCTHPFYEISQRIAEDKYKSFINSIVLGEYEKPNIGKRDFPLIEKLTDKLYTKIHNISCNRNNTMIQKIDKIRSIFWPYHKSFLNWELGKIEGFIEGMYRNEDNVEQRPFYKMCEIIAIEKMNKHLDMIADWVFEYKSWPQFTVNITHREIWKNNRSLLEKIFKNNQK